jgi:transcriptional regulator with XRE-family HTH domain
MMQLSEYIKDIRIHLGMSQDQLAKALNVSFSTINRWENDKAMPSNLAQKTFFDFCEENLIEIPAELKNNKAR